MESLFKVPFLPPAGFPKERRRTLKRSYPDDDLFKPSSFKKSRHFKVPPNTSDSDSDSDREDAVEQKKERDIYPARLTRSLKEWISLHDIHLQTQKVVEKLTKGLLPFLSFIQPVGVPKLYYRPIHWPDPQLLEHFLYVLSEAISPPAPRKKPVSWSSITKRLSLPISNTKRNTDVRVGFRWSSLFIVKKMFTTGIRMTGAEEVHILQTTIVPLVYYELRAHKRLSPDCIRRLDLLAQGDFIRYDLAPRKVYLIPENTTYCLLTEDKCVFALNRCTRDFADLLKREKSIVFHSPKQTFKMTKQKDPYDVPPATPFMDANIQWGTLLDDEEEETGHDTLPSAIQTFEKELVQNFHETEPLPAPSQSQPSPSHTSEIQGSSQSESAHQPAAPHFPDEGRCIDFEQPMDNGNFIQTSLQPEWSPSTNLQFSVEPTISNPIVVPRSLEELKQWLGTMSPTLSYSTSTMQQQQQFPILFYSEPITTSPSSFSYCPEQPQTIISYPEQGTPSLSPSLIPEQQQQFSTVPQEEIIIPDLLENFQFSAELFQDETQTNAEVDQFFKDFFEEISLKV